MRRLRFARYLLPMGIFLLISIWQRLPWLTLYLPTWMEPLTHYPQVPLMTAWGVTAVVALVRGPGRKRHLIILVLSILALGATAAQWTPLVGLLLLLLLGTAIRDPFVVLKEEGRSPAWGAIPVLLGIGIFTLCNRTTGAFLTKPGGVFHMHEIVQVEGGIPQDEILALYVNIQPETLLDRLLSLAQPTDKIPRQTVTALTSGVGNDLRVETQQMAMAIALKKLGRGRGANPQPFVQVETVNAAGPSAKLLLPGDQIQTVNGQAFTDLTSLRGYLRQQPPESTLQFSVRRKGETIETAVTLGRRPDDPALAYLGVTMLTPFAYDIPLHYTASSRGSGNSYGAIFALTVLDQLTPGGVTGGHVVAGTGTIEADGSVGLVGSVRLKAFVAARSGADVLFVPVEEAAEAQAGAGNRLTVVPVRTLQEMVDWLKGHPLKP